MSINVDNNRFNDLSSFTSRGHAEKSKSNEINTMPKDKVSEVQGAINGLPAEVFAAHMQKLGGTVV